MKSRFFLALPPIALVAACGDHPTGRDVPLTNTGNTVLNRAHDDYQFQNDEPPNAIAENIVTPDGNVM